MRFARTLSPILLALVLVGSAYAVVHAQDFGAVDPITITIDPQYPQPYQIITVTPESTLIDLSASTVTISVNGTVVQKGSGAQSASVAVGGPGKTTTITVTAVTGGQTYTQSLSIHPADVALMLEPISTVHPFYQGASLLASEGRLRIVALPDLRTAAGTTINPANLVYTWRNGEQVLQSASGIGKSVLSAVAPMRNRDTVISVTVTSQDSSVVGYAETNISPIDPVMRIYENDPLLGPRFETALLDSSSLTDSEKTYRMVPYFFGSAPTLGWQVNGADSQSGQDITVRPNGSGKGTALLTAGANDGKQAASAALSVLFGSEQSTGIFGL